MKSHIEYSVDCSGCGACADICPREAISLKFDSRGILYPAVDNDRCIECGACQNVCACNREYHYLEAREAYIAVCREKQLYEHSSSGGIFAIVAQAILSRGGVAYGAAVVSNENGLDCRIIKVDSIAELNKLQGSKYVHSRTDDIFREIKEVLQSGVTVLFSGTSCQVAALKSYLQRDYYNLYTTDLVCHGVPEITHLQAYLEYLEKKYKIKISNVSFRNKAAASGKENRDTYMLTLSCQDQESKAESERRIPKYLSAYFSLFLSRANYRPNCYACKYASIKKPGDITLGDFIPTSSEIEQLGLEKEMTYSSVFVRTDQGARLLKMVEAYCDLIKVPLSDILRHHKNLKQPSKITTTGKRLKFIYDLLGFSGLERFLKLKRLFSSKN